MDGQDILNRFTYQKPEESSIAKIAGIRSMSKNLAVMIDDEVPEGREKALAVTKLEEVVMWANAGIARKQN